MTTDHNPFHTDKRRNNNNTVHWTVSNFFLKHISYARNLINFFNFSFAKSVYQFSTKNVVNGIPIISSTRSNMLSLKSAFRF